MKEILKEILNVVCIFEKGRLKGRARWMQKITLIMHILTLINHSFVSFLYCDERQAISFTKYLVK